MPSSPSPTSDSARGPASPERLRSIRERVVAGYYDSEAVLLEVAEALLQENQALRRAGVTPVSRS